MNEAALAATICRMVQEGDHTPVKLACSFNTTLV